MGSNGPSVGSLECDKVTRVDSHNRASRQGAPSGWPTQFSEYLLKEEAEIEKASIEAMLGWWQKLQTRGGAATHAAIQFRIRPDQATKFLETRFDPVTLTERDLENLLSQLFSDEELEWQSAFEELEYKDPRLLKAPMEIFDDVGDQEHRNRLMAILCGYSIKRVERNASMNIDGKDAYLYVLSDTVCCNWGNSSLGVESDLAKLGGPRSGKKPSWNRARHAIAVLKATGTESAISKIKQIAGGHEKATPAIFAKQALKAIELENESNK